MTTLSTRPEFTDLSLLSLFAAHELERLERSEPSKGEYLSALRNKLAEQMPGRATRNDIRSIAPSTVELYRTAVREATKTDPPDFAALVKELTGLLDQLQRVSESASNSPLQEKSLGDLKPLLAFLVSIHAQLLAQKHRLISSRSAGRYRV